MQPYDLALLRHRVFIFTCALHHQFSFTSRTLTRLYYREKFHIFIIQNKIVLIVIYICSPRLQEQRRPNDGLDKNTTHQRIPSYKHSWCLPLKGSGNNASADRSIHTTTMTMTDRERGVRYRCRNVYSKRRRRSIGVRTV